MMNLKTEITKIHYSKEPSGLIFNVLKFCSIFYGIGSRTKNYLYDKGILKPKKVNAYVISVGNFTTGGVGKTPFVAELAKHFIDENKVKVAIVSRGYGGKLDNKNVNVISDGIDLYYKADMAGDEPYWLAVNLNMCAVLTCSNRYRAAKYAIEKLGVETIILDDGFQHRKLHRDLDIVLADSEKMFGNENLLPAGPLREGQEGFNRLDKLVIVSKNTDHTRAEKLAKILAKKCFQNAPNHIPNGEEKVCLCKIEPDYAYNIISGEHLQKGTDVTAISAIGQPEQFYNFLSEYNVCNKITFDDHHQYTIEDIENIEGNIITTEKDAVKLALLNKTNIYALKLKTVIDTDEILK
ncbi:MAG: tetraacyldisaccharide 4'-kinase [bacterium]|nr:tetraacyldisaccharide 4'-kinase [bacterium]